MGFVRLFIGLRGRLSRAEFLIIGTILGVLEELSRILVVAGVDARHPGSGELFSFGLADVASNVVMILFCWPTLCMTVKRYHDLDKSGWWATLIAAPVVLGVIGIVSYLEDAKDTGILLCALAVLAFIWPMIELGTFHGSPGDNDYGPRLGWKSLLPGLAKYLARREREAISAMAMAVTATANATASVDARVRKTAAPAHAPPRSRRARPATPTKAATGFGQRARLGAS